MEGGGWGGGGSGKGGGQVTKRQWERRGQGTERQMKSMNMDRRFHQGMNNLHAVQMLLLSDMHSSPAAPRVNHLIR